MGKNSAEYMRAYRARRKAESIERMTAAVSLGDLMVERAQGPLVDRIAELEEEVRHLKAELASRNGLDMTTFNQGIEPGYDDAVRRAGQASRDAILRKINRGG